MQKAGTAGVPGISADRPEGTVRRFVGPGLRIQVQTLELRAGALVQSEVMVHMGSAPAGALGGTVVPAGRLPEKLQQLDGCKRTGRPQHHSGCNYSGCNTGGKLVRHSGSQA